jgi:cullin 1
MFILYIPCVPRAIGLSWLMHRSHSLPLSNGEQFSFYISKESGAILRLIERQRNGETIDQGLVKKVMDSFVSLSIDESDLLINKAALDNYKEHFEIPFLSATEAYYNHESDFIVVENSVSDYLKKAEERLKEQEDRIERYLHTITRKLLF